MWSPFLATNHLASLRAVEFKGLMDKKKTLSPKQQRFVEEYLCDLNATKAAERAGYSRRTANEQGARLLAKVSVRNEIDNAIAERSKRTQHSADAVIDELSKLAYANILDYITVSESGDVVVDLSRITREQASAIQEITVDESRRDRPRRTRLKLADKRSALELLGKHEKMWTDRVEVKNDLSQLTDEELEKKLQECGFTRSEAGH